MGLTAAAAPIPCTVGGSRAKPKGVRLFSDLTLHRLLSGPIGFGSQGSISDLWGGHINRDESKGASGVAQTSLGITRLEKNIVVLSFPYWPGTTQPRDDRLPFGPGILGFSWNSLPRSLNKANDAYQSELVRQGYIMQR